MNTLFKTVLIILLCILLINCKRIVKEEAYLQAQPIPELKPVASHDLPRTTNALKVPAVQNSDAGVAPDTMPPEMAFAKRRSSDENVVIIESGGMPTIEIFNDQDVWQLMTADHGYNWLLLEEDPDNCQATLMFYDPITEEAKQGFFKRIFQVKNSYIDRSGEYVLTCLKLPQKQQIWLQTPDFKAPSSYVVDDLFTHIFKAATAEN